MDFKEINDYLIQNFNELEMRIILQNMIVNFIPEDKRELFLKDVERLLDLMGSEWVRFLEKEEENLLEKMKGFVQEQRLQKHGNL